MGLASRARRGCLEAGAPSGTLHKGPKRGPGLVTNFAQCRVKTETQVGGDRSRVQHQTCNTTTARGPRGHGLRPPRRGRAPFLACLLVECGGDHKSRHPALTLHQIGFVRAIYKFPSVRQGLQRLKVDENRGCGAMGLPWRDVFTIKRQNGLRSLGNCSTLPRAAVIAA